MFVLPRLEVRGPARRFERCRFLHYELLAARPNPRNWRTAPCPHSATLHVTFRWPYNDSGSLSLASKHRGSASISGQYKWDLWWLKLHGPGASPSTAIYPISMIPPMLLTHICIYRGPYGKVKQSHYRPGQALRVPGVWGSQILWQAAHKGGKVVSPTHRPPLPLILIFVRGWVNPRVTVRLEGLRQWKIPMTPSGIEPRPSDL